MSKLEIANFDIAQYLDDKEVIAEYLSQILSDRNTDELLEALGNIAKAQLTKDIWFFWYENTGNELVQNFCQVFFLQLL